MGDYSRLKIAWEDMDAPSSKSRKSLEGRLALLVQTIRTRDAPGTRTWNATMQGRIFADTEEKN